MDEIRIEEDLRVACRRYLTNVLVLNQKFHPFIKSLV